MRAIKLAAILTIALFCVGCWVLSFHPLYTDKDIVFEPGLLGTWTDPDDPEDGSWTFMKSGDKAFQLTVQEEGKPVGIFDVHLLRRGKVMFIDFFPEEPENVNEFYSGHAIPAHSFGRFSLEGNVLRIAFLDIDWLEDGISEGRLQIRHERRDDMIVLTASTEELQAFVQEHLEEAFKWDEVEVQLQKRG